MKTNKLDIHQALIVQTQKLYAVRQTSLPSNKPTITPT